MLFVKLMTNCIRFWSIKENNMRLDEAKQILKEHCYKVINESSERYVFTEKDEKLFAAFIKEYDAYCDFGSGVIERVSGYSNGTVTFEDKHGYLSDDNEADYDWVVDSKDLFADKKEVETFKSTFKPKRTRKSKQWTAREIAKLMSDNGITVQAIIDEFEKHLDV